MRLTEFRNHQRELFNFRLRIGIAGTVVLGAFLLLFMRFFYLQVIQHEFYLTKAEENRISIVPIVPNRGVITDRNGVVLARNYSAYTLEITPAKIGDLEKTINGLAELIDIQPKDRKRFRKLLDESKNFESLPIRNRLSDEEVARFAANRFRFPGVEIKARLFRQYTQNEIASHVMGYIGRINDRDLEWIEQEDLEATYRGTEHIGKIGLEQSYEKELHGVTGSQQVEIDAGGRAVRTLSSTSPVPGNNLTLTLDIKLQELAEEAFGDRRGAMVAIEPSTGGILAFVSKPGFDPNLFVDGIDPQNWDLLNNSPDKPLLNRGLRGTYPPGSTYKPFMALAALETGKRTATQTIYDPGFYNFGGHRFRDDKKDGHGYVDMYKSIVMSCDTYYYMLANDMGVDSIYTFMKEFGLGQLSGIDVQGEVTGTLPSSDWKMKRFKQKWYPGETISIGIGQGYNAFTPLQMAHAVATLANDGVVMKPHFVRTIQDARSGAVTQLATTPVRTITLKPENIAVIKKAMEGVNKEGTGARAFTKVVYTSAGKTGTAQVIQIKQNETYSASKTAERHRDHAWFIAFAPVERPQIALAVLVENGGFGAQAAAPIARLVMDYYLLGKKPDEPAKVAAQINPKDARPEDDESD